MKYSNRRKGSMNKNQGKNYKIIFKPLCPFYFFSKTDFLRFSYTAVLKKSSENQKGIQFL